MTGCPLVLKLVKPIKVARSRSADEFGINELLTPETQTQMRTAYASILRKPNPAVWLEVSGFYLPNRVKCDLAKLSPFLVRYGSLEVLNFRCLFPYKDNQGNIGYSGHPGVASELWVKGQ